MKVIRSTIPAPRNLTSRKKLLYKDQAGNKLYAQKGKTTSAQFSAVNAQGRLVDKQSVITMMRRWNRTR